jgi:hypothetical protein
MYSETRPSKVWYVDRIASRRSTVDRVIPPSPIGYGGQAEPCFDDPFPDYDTEPACRELAEPVLHAPAP